MNIGIEETRRMSEDCGEAVGCDEKSKGDIIGISKHVRTFAILTAENPFAQRLSLSDNMERNGELDKSLKEMNFVFRKVGGLCGTEDGGGNRGQSYCVYNISFSAAKNLAAKFNQRLFAFGEASNAEVGGERRENRMNCSFYAYSQSEYDRAFDWFKTENDGIEDEASRTYPIFNGSNYLKVDGNTDFGTDGGGFRFLGDEDAIAVVRKIDECAESVGEERFDRMLEESVDDSFTGKHQYHNRIMMYGRMA